MHSLAVSSGCMTRYKRSTSDEHPEALCPGGVLVGRQEPIPHLPQARESQDLPEVRGYVVMSL